MHHTRARRSTQRATSSRSQRSTAEQPSREFARLQRLVGNQAIQAMLGQLPIQRDPSDAGTGGGAAGVPSDKALDQEIARVAAGVCNQYLVHDAPFAPVVPTRMQTWSTFSTSNGVLDEDHFYNDSNGAEQHVKVRAFRGVGPDLKSQTGDTFWGRVVTWNDKGQEITVGRFSGWLEYNGGSWQVHMGPKPAPAAPPPPPPAPPSYDEGDQVPV
jgi:hypothetical protein